MEKYNDFTETENVTINPSKLDGIDYNYAGKGIIEYFENKPKRYKIKKRITLEHEIDEERKRVTINTFITGATVLATTSCVLLSVNDELDFVQRCAYILLSLVTSKGVYDSAKMLNESIKRKTNLEKTYFDTYEEEYEEKRGRSL